MIEQRVACQDGLSDRQRCISPIVGALALLVITVALATIVAVGVSTLSVGSTGPSAAFDVAVDGSASTIRIEHVAGDAIDVEALAIIVAVNGTELAEQPPVPFVGATGFDGAPTGPFNAQSTATWRSGTIAGVTVAETNSPEIERGDSVTVTLVVDGNRIETLETTAD